MRELPKIQGLSLSDDREFPGMESMSCCYLHCKAQDVNGYDCIVANIEAFRLAIRNVSFLADVTLTDGNEYKGLFICKYGMMGIEALVVLVDDIEGIKDALEYLGIKHRITLRDDHETEVKEKYPQAYSALFHF